MTTQNPEKQKAYLAKHYLENKASYQASKKDSRRKVLDKLIAIKEASPCVDCKVNYPYYVMQFDHLDSETKIDGVAALARKKGWVWVEEEILKCEIVCANCHAERSQQRLNAPFAQSGRASDS